MTTLKYPFQQQTTVITGSIEVAIHMQIPLRNSLVENNPVTNVERTGKRIDLRQFGKPDIIQILNREVETSFYMKTLQSQQLSG
jgi:hypothetical protein